MELMLDSSNLDEIRIVSDLGLLNGVTTNPVIIKRELGGVSFQEKFFDLAKGILGIMGKRPVFFQTIGNTYEEMVEQSRRIYGKLREYGNPHIKVPINTGRKNSDPFSGLNTLKSLKKEGIPTLATAIVTPSQAYLAGLINPEYVVLMLRNYDNIISEMFDFKLSETGYLEDNLVRKVTSDEKRNKFQSYLSGMSTLRTTAKLFHVRGLESKLIIAGVRNPVQFDKAISQEGVSAITISFNLFRTLLTHEGTKRFVEQTQNNSPESYRRFVEND